MQSEICVSRHFLEAKILRSLIKTICRPWGRTRKARQPPLARLRPRSRAAAPMDRMTFVNGGVHFSSFDEVEGFRNAASVKERGRSRRHADARRI